MRRLLPLLALAAFASPAAAKPGMPPDAAQTRYRTDAIAYCASRIGEAEGADPDEIEALCSCAADRLLADPLNAARDPARVRTALGPAVLRCLPEVRPANAGAIATAAMRPPDMTPPPPTETAATAPDKPATGSEAAAPSGPGLLDRIGAVFDRLSFSSLPRWAWIPIAFLGFLMLRRLFRRPERDDDLMGPPRPPNYGNLPRY